MKTMDVTFVRIYLTEAGGQMPALLARLHDEEKVRGVTVFRGISGFGSSGTVHSSTLMDMSLDLPVVVEFFDTPDRVTAIVDHLHASIEPGHMVSWPATLVV